VRSISQRAAESGAFASRHRFLIEKGRRVRDAIDDAHLTAQHIEELREVVNAGVSEIRTHSGHVGYSVPSEVGIFYCMQRGATKTAPYAAEFSVEPRKCAAETDWVAEEAVSSEPVSGEIPCSAGKYTEFRDLTSGSAVSKSPTARVSAGLENQFPVCPNREFSSLRRETNRRIRQIPPPDQGYHRFPR
jgi:hypothetical protein